MIGAGFCAEDGEESVEDGDGVAESGAKEGVGTLGK